MKLDFENITGCSRWFDTHLFTPYYRGLGTIHEPIWLRLGSPLIGIGDGWISTAQATVGLGEALLKGSVNTLCGALTADQRVFTKGLFQIVLGGGSIALLAVPIITARTIRITVCMAYDPPSALQDLQKMASTPQEPVAAPA